MGDEPASDRSLRNCRRLFSSTKCQTPSQRKHQIQVQQCQEEHRIISKVFNQETTDGTQMTPRLVKWLSQPVEALEEYLGARYALMILNFLNTNNVKTVGQLLEMSHKEVMLWANWGTNRMEALYEALEKIGFIRYTKC